MAFAQRGKKKKKVGDKEKKPKAAKDPKDFDKEWWKARSATGVARRDILPQPAQSNRSVIMTIS